MAYAEIELYENRNYMLLVPVKRSRMNKDTNVVVGPQYKQNYVQIDRKTAEIKKVDGDVPRSLYQKMNAMTRILGVIGIVNLLSGPFLITIVASNYIGSIKKNRLYKLSQIKLIPFQRNKYRELSEFDKLREHSYIAMIIKVFVNDQAIYYSYSCDLTQNFQKQSDILKNQPNSTSSTPATDNLWRFANNRFFWNHHLSLPFQKAGLDGYIIPMIRGYVDVTTAKINNKNITFGVISRVDSKRSGTRYNTRGADLNGNVANFVETEQVLIHGGLFASYIIIRGSIPLIWTQFANPLKYTPEVKFEEDKGKQVLAFRKHMSFLHSDYYDKIVAVNLCKEKGQEQLLSRYFKSLIDKVPLQYKVEYFPFDFHSETKGLRMERISILLNALSSNMKEFSFFLEQFDTTNEFTKSLVEKLAPIPEVEKPQPVEDMLLFIEDPLQEKPETPKIAHPNQKALLSQRGVFRVNCIDCCDRTNVVETAICRVVLEEQLFLLGVFKEGDRITHDETFHKIFQHFWANNGDRVSSLYAGTGALMGDFTRTGQRSVVGMMKDGVNAVSRYVQNNFKDSEKLRSIRLVLGTLDLNSPEETAVTL